jgi:hypothetical protein
MGREEPSGSAQGVAEAMMRAGDQSAVIVTMADPNFYLGLVALLNSLHLTGNADLPVVVLDAGLTPQQRESIGSFATFEPLVSDGRAITVVDKTRVGELGLSGVVLLIDADCIVTAPLHDLIRRAEAGRICAPRDDLPFGYERHFPEWEQLFGLRAPVREEGVYINAGTLCLSTSHWPELLARWAEISLCLPPGPFGLGRPDMHPIARGDQDVLNALLWSEIPPSALDVLPIGAMAYAQWGDSRVVDIDTLRVSARGQASTLAHFSLGPKPWTAGGWRRVGLEPLLPLVGRCLLGDGLVVRPDPEAVPWWLHADPTTGLRRAGVGAVNRVLHAGSRVVWAAYDGLPESVQAPLRRMRGREMADPSAVQSSVKSSSPEASSTSSTRSHTP